MSIDVITKVQCFDLLDLLLCGLLLLLLFLLFLEVLLGDLMHHKK